MSISSDGIYISDFIEYKKFLSEQYHPNWAKNDKVTNDKIRSHFGLPLRYPVVITLRKNRVDCFDNFGIHFIYLSNKPTHYHYTEEY